MDGAVFALVVVAGVCVAYFLWWVGGRYWDRIWWPWHQVARDRRLQAAVLANPFPGPKDCPRCSGRLELGPDGVYRCVGLSNRGEVEEYLGDRVPARMRAGLLRVCSATPPCTFAGPEKDYGKTWA